jgi:hypothetical protein
MFIGAILSYLICGNMALVTIRIKIPAKLKEEMDKIHIDWNEYICQCIQEKIDQELQKRSLKQI